MSANPQQLRFGSRFRLGAGRRGDLCVPGRLARRAAGAHSSVPRIAGLSPTSVVRQVFDMQAGTRNGPGAALMKGAAAQLTVEDMVSAAACLASLAP